MANKKTCEDCECIKNVGGVAEFLGQGAAEPAIMYGARIAHAMRNANICPVAASKLLAFTCVTAMSMLEQWAYMAEHGEEKVRDLSEEKLAELYDMMVQAIDETRGLVKSVKVGVVDDLDIDLAGSGSPSNHRH